MPTLRHITHNGRTLCLAEWARKLNTTTHTLARRLRRMSVAKAFDRADIAKARQRSLAHNTTSVPLQGVPHLPDDVLDRLRCGDEPTDEHEERAAANIEAAKKAIRVRRGDWVPQEQRK